METFIIRLENVIFNSHIGISDQERKVGNEFSADIKVIVDCEGFSIEDINSSINYAEIYDILSTEMKREWKLLESVAKTVGEKIKRRWPHVQQVKVKITKLSVPITGMHGVASVEFNSETNS